MSETYDSILASVPESDRGAFQKFISSGTLEPSFEARLDVDPSLQATMERVLDEMARRLESNRTTALQHESTEIHRVIGGMVPAIQQVVRSGQPSLAANYVGRIITSLLSPEDRNVANTFLIGVADASRTDCP